jgi:hypothetical protein
MRVLLTNERSHLKSAIAHAIFCRTQLPCIYYKGYGAYLD